MATQEILTQEKSLILLLMTDHHMTTVELNMTLKLAMMELEIVQINLTMIDLFLFLLNSFMKLQLRDPSQTFPLMPQTLTLGKESRFQTLLVKLTLFPTGNSTRAKTTCSSTTRTRLPSTLIRRDKCLITRERRLTSCSPLTKRELLTSFETTSLRTGFTVTLTSLPISSTLTISFINLKHGLIPNSGSTTQMLPQILQYTLPILLLTKMTD